MKFEYCAILLVLLSSSSIAGDSVSISELESNEARWNSQSFTSVSFKLREGGPFGYTEYKIKTSGEKCKANSRFVFGKEIEKWKTDSCLSHTPAEQFKKVKAQLIAGTIRSEIRFNPEFGYIEFYSVEPKTDAFDQDWYFEVSGFKSVRAK